MEDSDKTTVLEWLDRAANYIGALFIVCLIVVAIGSIAINVISGVRRGHKMPQSPYIPRPPSPCGCEDAKTVDMDKGT